MATDSITPKPLDIETLNALAVRLCDHADSIRNPAAQKLGTDLQQAADVASEHAHWRFMVGEIAAALSAGNFARNELLALIGKESSPCPRASDTI